MNPAQQASVAVVVFFKDEARYLADMLASIQQQTVPAAEVILVDDSSTDASATIAWQWLQADQRSHWQLHNNRGTGKVAAYQTGVQQVTADYCCICAGDDVLTAHYIERSLAYLAQHNVDYVFNNYTITDAQLQAQGIGSVSEPVGTDLFYRNTVGGYLVGRSALLKTILPFPEQLPFEDWYVALWLYSRYKRLPVNQAPLFYYRRHAASCSTLPNRRPHQKRAQLINRNCQLLDVLLTERAAHFSAESQWHLKTSRVLHAIDFTKTLDIGFLWRTIKIAWQRPSTGRYVYWALKRYGAYLLAKIR